MKYLDRVLRTYFLLWIFTYLFDEFSADNSMIDELHLKKYPYCGSMSNGHASTSTAGRVANSETPDENYRWALYILRTNKDTHGLDVISSCTGSVITERFVCTTM